VWRWCDAGRIDIDLPDVLRIELAPPGKVSRDGIAHVVEIKTPAGELSDPQQSVMTAVLAGGGRVGVVRNAEEMLGLLDAWGIPRARCLAVRGRVYRMTGTPPLLP
jgi:hypothetical protein